MPQWTPQQADAITDRGHSLIVCAAAGSGKTAVLVERIVQLIREGCGVEEMLIVTFTNAAASEMRLRIGEALHQAARECPELGAQELALSRASISTLHRFCGSLLREHFQALGIDPAFRIGDEQECGVLSRQAMEDALYSCYDVGSEAFLAADRCYTQEDMTELAQSIHTMMMTRPDPWAWLERAQQATTVTAEQLMQSEAVALLMRDAQTQLTALYADARALYARCMVPGGPAHYAAACAQDVALIQTLCEAADGYAALHDALGTLSFATLGRKKKGDLFDAEEAERVKAGRDALKDALKALAASFALSPEDAAADIRLTSAPLAGLCELTRTYDALYAAAKRQRGLLDFDDLEHGALAALEHPSVCASLRARYRYVFIDEYQDSSAIQEAIIRRFAREDGLFLVGDVKQSIYRFRQAEPRLFLEKAAQFDRPDLPSARRIDLQRNFRSRANVLAGVNAVFARVMRAEVTEIAYDERERLFCGLPEREDDPPIELHLLYKPPRDDEQAPEADAQTDESASEANDAAASAADDAPADERELAAIEQEALIAAERIRALVGTPLWDAKRGETRPLQYRDIAILMRAARGGAPLAADVLKAQGIPAFCDAGEGYFDMPEVREMMALLTAIANGAQDEALLAALRGPALGLSDAELAQIRLHTPDTRIPFAEATRRYRDEQTDALADKLTAFAQRLARWRLCARHQGVDRLLERIYAETGLLAQAGALPGGAARQANLHLLTARARAFMQAQGGSLHAFLRYAKRLRAAGDNLSASAIGESEDVVRIMTTHKSKGLEFPVVLVLGMGRRLGGTPRRALLDAELGIGLPCIDTQLGSERDTLLRRAMRVKEARAQLAEEVRILYVAMTRARDRLLLIGSVGAPTPPARWETAVQVGDAALPSMRTALDMVCPTLLAAGASLTAAQETTQTDGAHWLIHAHRAGDAQLGQQRTDERVQRMLAALEAVPCDAAMAQRMAFVPQAAAAVRKTSVSAVLRDERRMEPEELAQREHELMRLPRFMQEQRVTGAQIGTALHRALRMFDLDALRAASDLHAEVVRQMDVMRAEGVLTEAEARAAPPRMATRFFAAPLGQRLLKSPRVEREWAFTYRRQTEAGVQLLQGVIDCCFVERGAWVLVDFKTDADIDGAAERHAPQVALYAEALAALTDLPVAERALFMVRAGVALPV